MFPWIGKWVANRKEIHTMVAANKEQNRRLFTRLKETFNPQMCRGFVDSFLLRKQNLEVGKLHITNPNKKHWLINPLLLCLSTLTIGHK